MTHDAYKNAGVNIDAGHQATQLMKKAIQSTYTEAVLSEVGSFGGLFAADILKNMDMPILVASTDGVGTKTMVAAKVGKWDTIGQDLVNHCINDILVQGAKPLFFLDYVASSQLNPQQIAAVVSGCAKACRETGTALLGGETAEMPGVYQPGELDLVGTIIGVVDRSKLIDGKAIQAGDVVMALPSTGLHTNGYSLARKVLEHINWAQPHSALGESVGEALMKIHRCYLADVQKLWQAGITIKGMAHITGGGIIDNLPRILPDGLGATIQRGTWSELPIFQLIQSLGQVTDDEMFRVFNMGLGMVLIFSPADSNQVISILDDVQVVGEITPKTGVQVIG
ncbi:MAG: phosphoribosylformylglycinamidine cyclo-ligase [Phototrophicales bacterium]